MISQLLEPKVDTTQVATHRKLLAAAAEVFAEVGFRAATVRQICERAGANIAAVNYHFGDKDALYAEVLKRAYAQALQKYPPDFGLPARATPEQRLRAFVRAFLLRIFDDGPHSHHGKLMAREMIEPTGALDGVVRHGIRPQADTLHDIVRELLGKGAGEKQIRLCSMSVVSQALFYHHCRPVVARMFPDMKFTAKQIEELAEHITRFSLAAIRGYAAAARK
ncbi:MAG: CerR family C-terminal domain-containing protein [Verrucomicrobia bacterium]|nr:CerR family C-terminal domain-containing protein [Verrucomicrobiota bacterium]